MKPLTMGDLREWIAANADAPDETPIMAMLAQRPREWAQNGSTYSNELLALGAVGLVLAAVSLAVMPALSGAQRRTGRQLDSVSAVADSKQTLLCTYLSALLLLGLGLNSLFGWWWADPLAALVIAAVAVKEGRDAWRGDTCCPPMPSTTGEVCADDCCPR